MTDIVPASRESYYRDAESWAGDRLADLRASRRIAWWVATAAAVVAVLEALALLFLTPLKTVVPYTLLVDRQTGYVQALDPINAERIAPDAALTRSFLAQYVIARENFDIDALNENYRKVALWSAGTARSDYISGVQASHPTSPLARYPRSTVVDTRVKSISALRGDTAFVRFETRRRDADGRARPGRQWVAVIRYRFSTEPLAVEDRLTNPLGFQVLRYNRSEEAPSPPEPAPAPTTVIPAQTTTIVTPPGSGTTVVTQPAYRRLVR